MQENRLPHGDVVVTDEDDVNSNILVIIITTFGVTGQLHPQIRVIGQVHGVREANGLVRTRLVGVSTHVEVECFIVVFDNIVLDIIMEATEVEQMTVDWFTDGAHVRHVLLDRTRVWSLPLQRVFTFLTGQPHGTKLLGVAVEDDLCTKLTRVIGVSPGDFVSAFVEHGDASILIDHRPLPHHSQTSRLGTVGSFINKCANASLLFTRINAVFLLG